MKLSLKDRVQLLWIAGAILITAVAELACHALASRKGGA